jgi:hypothetical protein
VFGIAQLAEISWIWIALMAAGAHLLFAVIAVIVARVKMLRAPFPELAAELKKDREWLKTLDVNSRPTN